MALRHDAIDDFVNMTLKLFKRHKWTDISLPYEHYVSATMLDKKKVTEAGGEQISFRMQTKNTGLARNTGLFGQDETGVEDVTVSVNIPWAMQTTNFSYDIYEEMFQSDRETIIRVLQMRDHVAMNDMAELNEENLWSAPTGTSDTRPMGIPFWIQKDATTTPGGAFNGGNPSGFSGGAGGVDSSTYPRWKNWTFGYTTVSTDDLVKKTRKALAKTHFVPPVAHPELGYGNFDYVLYTTYDVQEALERLAETRNENLGADLARYINATSIGGAPVRYVPYLDDNDSSAPIYGVNFKVFRPFVKKGANMRRNPPHQPHKQHTVRVVHTDNWCNYMCVNRRLTFVGSTS